MGAWGPSVGDTMDDELMELMKTAVDKFNKRAKDDEKLKKQLEGVDRRVMLEFHDCGPSNFHLKDMEIGGIKDGAIEEFEIKVITDQDTMKALLKKELSPMKAYATGKVKFKASLTDLLTLKKLFSE